jgi:8-oxo-dGTP pyrophosphatase MutT (NUDIX family)
MPVTRATYEYWRDVRRKRSAEVVLALRRLNGLFLVHTKAFYPPGTYRLLSGGIKAGEDLEVAVRREAFEETGLAIAIERFLAIAHYRFAFQGQESPFTSYLLLVAEMSGALQCNDRDEAISGYAEVTLDQVNALADDLEALSADWRDWGRFRAIGHRLVVEALR